MIRLPYPAVAALVPIVLVLGACSERPEPEVPEVPGAAETATPEPESTEEPVSDPTDLLDVPFECSELLTAGQVARILQAPLDGDSQRIYNDEHLRDSGRTGRLTCRYGVPSSSPGTSAPTRTASPSPTAAPDGPGVEISVSSYIDAETAAGRIDSTLGSSSREVDEQTVGGAAGYLLTGDDEVTYVVARGVRTYVITLRRGLVPEPAEVVVILELATAILADPDLDPDDA